MSRRTITMAILAFLICALNTAIWVRYADATRAWRSVTITLSSPVRVGSIEPALQTLPDLRYATYEETPEIAIQSDAYPDRHAQVTLLRFTGDADCIAFFPRTSALPRFDQPDTCAIDRATAYLLWGSIDVLGQRLWMQEGSFIVSCVLNTSQRIMIVYARNDVEITRVALQTPEDGYVKLEEMATTLGIKGSISDDTERVTLWIFFALAPWLIAVFFLLGILPMKKCWRVMGYGVLTVVFLYLFLSKVPEHFFPNRWSDFNFYAQIPQLIKTFADNGSMIRDRMMAWDRNCLVGMALANCIIVWLLVKIIKKPRVLKGSSNSIAFYRFDRRWIR